MVNIWYWFTALPFSPCILLKVCECLYGRWMIVRFLLFLSQILAVKLDSFCFSYFDPDAFNSSVRKCKWRCREILNGEFQISQEQQIFFGNTNRFHRLCVKNVVMHTFKRKEWAFLGPHVWHLINCEVIFDVVVTDCFGFLKCSFA